MATNWQRLVTNYRLAIIPAPALKAVILAQWILESGRGTSRLANDHCNFSGLKFRPEMASLAKSVTYTAYDGVDQYCAFDGVSAFIQGYWLFVQRPMYHGWSQYEDDPVGFIHFLASRGFSSDQGYAVKVLSLLPEAEQLLQENASLDAGDEPDRPGRMQLGPLSASDLGGVNELEFRYMANVRHHFRGERPNGVEGAIVHYDSSPRRPRSGPDDAEWGARQALRLGEKQGYAYATISRSGAIYLPSNFDWLQWGYHAGQSHCPRTDRNGVSEFYVGFEVNCPGLVYKTADPDQFVPWYNAVTRDTIGSDGKLMKVVDLDSNGHATIQDKDWEVYRKEELRFAPRQQGNIRSGSYVPFTHAQHESLMNVMMYLKRTFTKSFRLDYVFGHDEVSPSRKVDPGASLGIPSGDKPGKPLSMAALRSNLLKRWAEEQTTWPSTPSTDADMLPESADVMSRTPGMAPGLI